MVLIISVGTIWSQINITSDQLFGGTRVGNEDNSFDFKTISKPQEHEFYVANSNLVSLTLKSTEVPEGFNVVIVDKILKPNSIGKVIVKVFPDQIKSKGDFEQKIRIISEYEMGFDKVVKEIVFTVKGKVE